MNSANNNNKQDKDKSKLPVIITPYTKPPIIINLYKKKLTVLKNPYKTKNKTATTSKPSLLFKEVIKRSGSDGSSGGGRQGGSTGRGLAYGIGICGSGGTRGGGSPGRGLVYRSSRGGS